MLLVILCRVWSRRNSPATGKPLTCHCFASISSFDRPNLICAGSERTMSPPPEDGVFLYMVPRGVCEAYLVSGQQWVWLVAGHVFAARLESNQLVSCFCGSMSFIVNLGGGWGIKPWERLPCQHCGGGQTGRDLGKPWLLNRKTARHQNVVREHAAVQKPKQRQLFKGQRRRNQALSLACIFWRAHKIGWIELL